MDRTTKLMLTKIELSGLDEEDAQSLGLTAYEGSFVKTVEPHYEDRDAMHIPYLNISGDGNFSEDFYRLRYLSKPKGFRATSKKPQKYTQPAKIVPKLYLPNILKGISWTELLNDPNRPLIFTEGELKAACATKFGYPTIGLGGVFNWKSKAHKLPYIPDFDSIKWIKRTIYIIFDSDLKTNPMVQIALNQLAALFLKFGAIPHIAFIPETIDENKAGLDDFIIDKGIVALNNLLEDAMVYSLTKELWKLNETVVYIKNPGFIIDQKSRQIYSPADFCAHAFSNIYYYTEKYSKTGSTSLIKEKAARAWVDWEARYEARKLVYEPGKDPIVWDEKEQADCYNMWTGWGCTPKPGDVTPWTKLLDFMFKSNTAARVWFEKWCAIQFQQPGVKLHTCCVFWGNTEGTGKTLVGVTLGKIFGEDNFAQIQQATLHNSFNGYLNYKNFVLGDEVTSADSRRSDADTLKNLITQDRILINEKWVKEVFIRDCLNYYFTSNHADAFFLSDNDRRFFINEVKGPPLPPDFYTEYGRWLAGEGPSYLFDYFLNYDLDGFYATQRAHVTQSKKDMFIVGMSDLDTFCYDLKHYPGEVCFVRDVKYDCELVCMHQLLTMFELRFQKQVSAQAMSKTLKKNGFKQFVNGAPIRTKKYGTTNLWILDNVIHWTNDMKRGESYLRVLGTNYFNIHPLNGGKV